MTIDAAGLRASLEDRARTTWSDIADGRRLSINMGETTITDHNLLALGREHPTLITHKHPAHEEVRTGADWEWWIGTAAGWTSLVFQAKKLDDDGRYPGINKVLPNGIRQVEALIRTCWDRSNRFRGAVWPLYCFYNSWPGGWPSKVPSLLYPDDPRRQVGANELPLYGCAVTDALRVRQIIRSRAYSRKTTLRDTYLPHLRPWSELFPAELDQAALPLTAVMGQLSRWMAPPTAAGLPAAKYEQRMQALARVPSKAVEGVSAAIGDTAAKRSNRPARRNRQVVWQDPSLIHEPPQYVIDLLEGRARPRRLKPLARWVAVLFED